MTKTLVMKFGGAAVATPECFSQIAKLIVRRKNEFTKIAVVISAMANTTDQLISLAKQVNDNPPQREYDMLITVGERISSSLLAMALAKENQNAISFTGSQSGIITNSEHANAKIVDVRPKRLLAPLEKGDIVIVAGFQGVSREGEITTLGRGGSDTTAVALGIALGAEKIEFYKDVPGIFTKDPKINPDAAKLDRLSYGEAAAIVKNGAKILHLRSIELASKNSIPLHVRSFSSEESPGTTICPPDEKAALLNPVYEEE
jgi:aspartate kinase